MSVDAALYVNLCEYRVTDILGVYLKRGMSVFDGDNRVYAVVSDNDEYDWEYLSVPFGELAKITDDRERRGVPVGISLYENGEWVTCLLKTEPDKLCVFCDINRKTFCAGSRRYTDVNRYIEKFIAPLEENGFAIAGFEFCELR